MFSRQRTHIRNNTAESNLFTRRAIIAFFGVCVLVGILLINLYNIQVNSHESYQTRANGNRIKLIPTPPNRGVIFDRNGVILAENRPVHSLELVAEQIKDIKKTVASIAEIIALSEEAKQRFFKSVKAQRRFKSVVLKSRLTAEEVAKISVQLHRLPGVKIEARLKRYYPFGESLTHVMGYVGRITRKEQQAIIDKEQEAIYAATRDIGKQGIEKYYQELLHGKPGYKEVEVNNRGRIFRVLNEQLPEHGQDLYLNIDINIQQKAYEALAGRRGSVVALDPNNGAVLAMVSSPSYDPNLFVHGISSKEYKKLLSPDKPLINRATQGAYPPASTIKQLMALVALEENIVTEHTSIDDPGWYQLPNVKRKFKDHLAWGHGKVDVYKAMAKSCDTYFYDIAYRLGIDKISSFMYQFGFGEYTGVDIHEEKSAIMPSRGWKRARHNQPWYVGDTISLGIGQSYWTATPLQLAKSTAIVATSGEVFTPQILGASQGELGLLQIPADDSQPVVLKQHKHWRIAQKGMWDVVNDPGGTAYNVFKSANYVSAGKTGTAQVIGMAEDEEYDETKIAERHRDNAMYVGYAPYINPEIAVSVTIENAGGGGSNAAPIAKIIFDEYMNNRTLSFDNKLTTVNQQVEQINGQQ
ncbi:penicillin-binding protein 2 [Psychrobium sp. 1_MG-2023]|uniref:penicillin-binding protein 2 n=1 Tax=Psychrobium sp. 1_MG-2023 TaxID=3062624 RepID=UPI000C3340A4|nr:penicillin-binding protein 2 [Psychrobium sp. 1_MG-2023]MDP2561251.1 penicillin-binding protein 2 [Psychrobium sp. 1_MG-2023]PKF55247.1 penicillin-binding protein 2 [Alteromonadales bacterium alter-6D02]